ncbi:winged helix-turn-helix domain-containing protein [Ruminococcus sp. CLA-AA-H200]|uniref:Winged helix-turn-helix domain-containing protein n=1 Tax=Ruminococcus turbiniformis TaxID=2881258 RepID=A0ABS8G250_9FIRM|nr:winged helix-turn-helix domain-containing protein [Ruminococcus turbiniformis]MCC2256296.1 winged helix-turn-helix domain-containing protein [Ruminococcus turbiniformis]
MEQIEIILRTTDPTGKVTEQLLAKFDTEKPATESDEVLEYSGLCIDSLRHQASYQGQEISLTENYEFHTLAYLASQPGRVYTKEQIYQAVWKEEPVDVRSAVFCIIGNIRQKLWQVTTKEYIQTVWGVGYKFVDVPGE